MEVFHVGYMFYNIFLHKGMWQVYPCRVVGENKSELIKKQLNKSAP